jgi:hypothetical protein
MTVKPFYQYKNQITIYHGDTIEVMTYLIAQGITVDAIMADLPYNTTSLKWDILIPMNDHILLKDKPIYYEAYLLGLIKGGASFTPKP